MEKRKAKVENLEHALSFQKGDELYEFVLPKEITAKKKESKKGHSKQK